MSTTSQLHSASATITVEVDDSLCPDLSWSELDVVIPRACPTTPAHPLHTQLVDIARGATWRLQAQTPGKYWQESGVLYNGSVVENGGGDCVLMLSSQSGGFDARKFTHDDFFEDIADKTVACQEWMRGPFAQAMCRIIQDGACPLQEIDRLPAPPNQLPGIEYEALLVALDLLAFIEHRRYYYNEKGKDGGRYLHMRFALGIIFGKWTAEHVRMYQKSGLRGLERLRRIVSGGRYTATPDPSYSRVMSYN